MLLLGELLKYISLIVIINSFLKIVKDILTGLPKNDYLSDLIFELIWVGRQEATGKNAL